VADPSVAKRTIEELREARGDERVTFADVADHLIDALERRPDAASEIGMVARYLKDVEQRPHDHGDDGLGSSEDAPRPSA
jgi:hypothetical protein